MNTLGILIIQAPPTPPTQPYLVGSFFITVHNKVAKVMFLQVCVCPWRGGGGIPACLAGGIPACLAAGLGGCYPSMYCRWYPSMPCNRSPGGCLPAPGECGDPPKKSRWLLLWTVCILLECILVNNDVSMTSLLYSSL